MIKEIRNNFLLPLLFLLSATGSMYAQCDTTTLGILLRKSKSLNTNLPDTALKLALRALELSGKCSEPYWRARASQQAASSYDYLSKADSAMACYRRYLYWSEKGKDSVGIADAYNMIGALYIYQAEYPTALSWCMKGLVLAERIKSESVAGSSYGNIGNIYYFQAKYDEALKYWLRCLEVQKKLNNVTNIVTILSNISAYYNEKEDFKTSIRYLEECLDYSSRSNDHHGEMIACVNLGTAFSYDLNNAKALEYFLRARKLAEELGDNYNLMVVLSDIGDTYLRLKSYQQSEKFFLSALEVEKNTPNPIYKQSAIYGLYKVCDSTHRYKEAVKYLLLHADLKDSVLNQDNQKQILEMQTKYDTDKKDQENKLLQTKDELSQKTIKSQRITALFLIVGILLALLMAVVIFRSYRLKKKDNAIITSQKMEVEMKNSIIQQQKAEVEEKQKEILDSIHYAKRIQNSLLTSEKTIERTLERLKKGTGK